MSNYIFLLWREPELSMAELKSIFPTMTHRGMFAFLETDEDISSHITTLGGTIKVGKILSENGTKSGLEKICVEAILPLLIPEKKTRIAIDSFVLGLNNLVFKVKDSLKNKWHSIRVVQHDNGHVKTATTLHEKLIERGCELMIVADGAGYMVAQTLWVQDIDAYTRRDMGRERSMKVGMMPPKLAQIMINMWIHGDKSLQIWDAFCGLGTTLTEAYTMWYHSLLGSDIAEAMVAATTENMKTFEMSEWSIFHLDARRIDTKQLSLPTTIVTEGMLWHNFTPWTLTYALATRERDLLQELYTSFFASAYKNTMIENIVICLPVWNIWRERIYMPSHTTLAPGWKIDPLCLSGKRYVMHARPWQSVTREILVLRRK